MLLEKLFNNTKMAKFRLQSLMDALKQGWLLFYLFSY